MAVRRPIVIDAGQLQELPQGDSVAGATGGTGSGFTPSQVVAGTPLTVPEYNQWIVYANPLLVDDDLTLDGDLVLLL